MVWHLLRVTVCSGLSQVRRILSRMDSCSAKRCTGWEGVRKTRECLKSIKWIRGVGTSAGAEWGGECTKDRWCLNTLNVERPRECKINQQRSYWCPTSAMVHTHANWCVVEPHGTGLDSLHHQNSMSNVTIHLRMIEQTHKLTLCTFIKVVLELWRDNVMLPYSKPLNKAWIGYFPLKKRTVTKTTKKNHDLLFSLLSTQQTETKEDAKVKPGRSHSPADLSFSYTFKSFPNQPHSRTLCGSTLPWQQWLPISLTETCINTALVQQ